ncbi:hypothetical protein BR63_16075 [Thermanaerosceptrum fracticalcis]|uniref:Transposase IS200-like domain-containing protein n=1 Tax=Thermanaerosceptrum fracticalcis TaxID=1712410 RepID=A0A7G6E6F3_THEFR|nr:transposase [Thermanaerosceptrum fracticalcis]QNB47657.1 hypothetical protein BR63_16075 [Thermanaerosceptrum fracticalcis]
MPRRPRTYSESKVYHIMTRGNEKKNLFYDREDREKFLNIIMRKKTEEAFCLYAYCLMDNHIHLLIRENLDSISTIMKKLNTAYAIYFNKNHPCLEGTTNYENM